jgi:lysozyme family protein
MSEITVMARDRFADCLAEVLKHEGGFVNNRFDPGGMTHLGVTRKVWENWTHKAACEADMRALKQADVAPLYRVNYWNALGASVLPAPVALSLFDFGVNSGVSRAARYFQRVVGALEDGHIGPGSLAAFDTWVSTHSVAEFVRQYANLRRAFYKSLPTFAHFGKGWLRRVDEVETAALRLAS